MRRSRLIIVCGVPGAGKSTFASRLVAEWSAASYASETFTAALGPAARDASGDLTREAIDRHGSVRRGSATGDTTATMGELPPRLRFDGKQPEELETTS